MIVQGSRRWQNSASDLCPTWRFHLIFLQPRKANIPTSVGNSLHSHPSMSSSTRHFFAIQSQALLAIELRFLEGGPPQSFRKSRFLRVGEHSSNQVDHAEPCESLFKGRDGWNVSNRATAIDRTHSSTGAGRSPAPRRSGGFWGG